MQDSWEDQGDHRTQHGTTQAVRLRKGECPTRSRESNRGINNDVSKNGCDLFASSFASND